MRVESYTIGSVVHVINRGARGMDIVRDDTDRWRFVRILYLLNDVHQDSEWTRTSPMSLFERPAHWPERDPLVSILSWTLMPNHFHLLLYESREGGVSKFMHRLGGSMTTYFNEKYGGQGSIFQGSYKSRTVDTDAYLQYVLSYIIVKNVFELYPGGLKRAIREFDRAWEWAKKYPFSSFQTVIGGQESPVIDLSQLRAFGLPGFDFKKSAYNMLMGHNGKHMDTRELLLEEW